jgi:hydroxylamine reductase (hybrid-cluster protein)
MSELSEQNCQNCGILFGIPKIMETNWRATHKVYFCPNGHALQWQDEAPEKKELTALKAQVKQLQDKLTAAVEKTDQQTKQIEALTFELEIWKPTDKAASQ